MSEHATPLGRRVQDWLIGATLGAIAVTLLLGKVGWDQRAAWRAEVDAAREWSSALEASLTERDAQLAEERASRAVLEARVALARVQAQLAQDNFGAARRHVEEAALVLKSADPDLAPARDALAALDLHPSDPVPTQELDRIAAQLDDALNL